MQKVLPLFVLGLLLHTAAMAQDQPETRYSLFKATPKDQMREFSIDRPDVTESPITVDGGHFQFEGDMIKWTKANGGDSERTINFMSGLYKIGLTHTWDVHLGIEMYNITQDNDGKTLEKGYGATFIRLKHNFWGNDGESKTALGIIPSVIFGGGNPFKTDNDVSFGVGFPFSVTLSETLGLGAQPQFDFLPDPVTGDFDLSYFQTIVLGGPLIGAFDYYVEGLATFYQSTTNYSANGGIIYNPSDNVKIDIATNLGLNKEAPTKVYLGLSFRI